MEAIVVAIVIAIGFFWLLSGNSTCGVCSGKGKALQPFPDSFKYISIGHRPFGTVSREWYCTDCEPKIKAKEQAILRAQNRDPLATWPETYKGRIPVVAESERPLIFSDWRREKDSAKGQLLITAAFLNEECNAVTNISFDKGTGQSGNYRYTQWRASGVPCQVKK